MGSVSGENLAPNACCTIIVEGGTAIELTRNVRLADRIRAFASSSFLASRRLTNQHKQCRSNKSRKSCNSSYCSLIFFPVTVAYISFSLKNFSYTLVMYHLVACDSSTFVCVHNLLLLLTVSSALRACDVFIRDPKETDIMHLKYR